MMKERPFQVSLICIGDRLTKMRENRQWKLIPVAMITTEGSRQRGLAAVDPGAAGCVRVCLEIAGHTMTKARSAFNAIEGGCQFEADFRGNRNERKAGNTPVVAIQIHGVFQAGNAVLDSDK